MNDNNYRVIFAVRRYYPVADPIGTCVISVQKALFDLGVKSDVIMTSDRDGFVTKNEFGSVYGIKANTLSLDTSFNSKIEHAIKALPFLFTWPVRYPKQLKRMIEGINVLNDKYHYDAIIGTSLPIETVLAASHFNNSIVYELDALSNNPEYKRGIKKIYRKRVLKYERKIFDNASLILHLIQNKHWFENGEYKQYSHKSQYVDIPNLIHPNIQCTTNSKDYPLMVYAGALVKDVRSPEYLLKLLLELETRLKFECRFYSRGNCEQMVEQYDELSNHKIKKMGYVEPDRIENIMMESNFLLSIGNHLTGDDHSLPSKIITYMAMGKPIIHIAGINDSAIPYLEKYGLALIINPNDGLSTNVNKVQRFIENNKNTNVDFETVRDMFPMNDPKYTANIILNFIARSTEI